MIDVVVTGLGLVTPIGIGIDRVWESLLTKRSGAGPITSLDTSDLPVRIACEVDDFDATAFISAREAARMDRFCQLGVAAALLAWTDAGLEDLENRDRVGAVIGSGIGGLSTIEQEHENMQRGGARAVSPFTVPKLMPNAAAAAAAMSLGLRGPNLSVGSACATGAHAIGEAAYMIRSGRAEVVLAGGTEAAITPVAISAFSRMGALSNHQGDPAEASRPFDAARDGFVFGEGAGVVVLESLAHASARNAHIRAELVGYGASADAFHLTQPDPDGIGASLAMERALDDARSSPIEVDYVNAHGTSTPYNDKVETIAIKRALGVEAKRIPVSSTKSQTGHLLGAAGAVEAAITVLAIERGVVPATINLETEDPDCDLDYVGEGPREAKVELALSNSFGFGGQNACLAFKKI